MTGRRRLPGLSAVVPARDEGASIAGVVRGLLRVLPRIAHRYEIIVVDDGSRDRTAAVVARLSTGAPGVRLVRHVESRGYGTALRTGFAAAREPWCFFTDGDGQFDPHDLDRLAAAAGEADLVAGYRVARADPAVRRLLGVLWTRLVRGLLGVPVRDVNCAFKLVRREVLAAVALSASGAAVNAELLAKAMRCGFRLCEVPVSHRPRRAGKGSGAAPRVVWRALRELAALPGAVRVAERQAARMSGTRPVVAAAPGAR